MDAIENLHVVMSDDGHPMLATEPEETATALDVVIDMPTTEQIAIARKPENPPAIARILAQARNAALDEAIELARQESYGKPGTDMYRRVMERIEALKVQVP